MVRQIFESTVDLFPDPEPKTLTVRLHRLSSPIHQAGPEHLCTELNASETIFPGTELQLFFKSLGTTSLPRDQESLGWSGGG